MPEYDATIEYRDIEGFPGHKVGNDGSTWTLWQQEFPGWARGSRVVMGIKWVPLRQYKHGKNNRSVGLRTESETRYFSVSGLVLTAFVGPRPTGFHACHFPDRSRGNNRLDNL